MSALTPDQIETRKRIQLALKLAGFDPGPVDGIYGKLTQIAILQFQSERGLEQSGQPDPATMAALFPQPVHQPSIFERITMATFADYFLNFISSKIVWASGATVGLIVAWISTKFGIQVPPDIVTEVTGWIAGGGFALVALLRTFWNKPVVATGQPKVVTKP